MRSSVGPRAVTMRAARSVVFSAASQQGEDAEPDEDRGREVVRSRADGLAQGSAEHEAHRRGAARLAQPARVRSSSSNAQRSISGGVTG